MKQPFDPGWLIVRLSGILPDSILTRGKKTPWYRQSWLSNAPWLAVALIAPLALFLIWKGMELVLPKGDSGTQSTDGQPASIHLT